MMIRLASRKSPLALLQTEQVAAALDKIGISTKIVPLSTTGDEILDRPLHEIGGKELFIKTLQHAIANGRADVAVHSLKDMAATTHPDFTLAAVGFAEDPRDVFISKHYNRLADLPANAVIGTCSPRRQALLKQYAPSIQTISIRGNLQTRLKKIENSECDAIVLAAAGIQRLGLNAVIKEYLSINQFIPAAGQGVIALECLATNHALIKQLAPLNKPLVMKRINAERAFAAAMQADCSTALGSHATLQQDGSICLQAFYQTDTGQFLQTTINADTPKNAGRQAAEIIGQNRYS